MDAEPKDVRLPLMVSQSELEAIDAWRFAEHMPSRAEAIRRLIELGLKALGRATQPETRRARRRSGARPG